MKEDLRELLILALKLGATPDWEYSTVSYEKLEEELYSKQEAFLVKYDYQTL